MKFEALKAPEWLSKNAIYQINPRTFSKEGTIKAITKELEFLKATGFNIVYLCPIFEMDESSDLKNFSKRQMASGTGNPKNMYRMNDYFTIDEEYGTIDDLREMVAKAHELDMKVIFDLVYAHIGPNAPIIKRHPEFIQQTPDGSIINTSWNFPALDFTCEGLREYLYCNMIYFLAVIDVDGFRCDVGDLVPIDFWKEAKRRMQCIKPDAVLLNEGFKPEYLQIAFDANYSFGWHDRLRKIYCGEEPANILGDYYVKRSAEMPYGAKRLRDIDTHDTVTDWEGRTETIVGANGMEQIEVLNYLIDGIPMVYSGNELACTAYLNMFANRFYPGKYEVTDRDNKSSDVVLRRLDIFKKLNKMKSESNLLLNGKTEWIDTAAPECVLAFKRVLGESEIVFVGNAKNCEAVIDADIAAGRKCILSNGDHTVNGGKLTLKPYEYVVFE